MIKALIAFFKRPSVGHLAKPQTLKCEAIECKRVRVLNDEGQPAVELDYLSGQGMAYLSVVSPHDSRVRVTLLAAPNYMGLRIQGHEQTYEHIEYHYNARKKGITPPQRKRGGR